MFVKVNESIFTKLRRILRFVRKQIGFSRRLDQEELEQKAEGYRIKLINGFGRSFVLYRDGDKNLILDLHGTLDNNTALFAKGLEFWFEPRGERLSALEQETAKKRLVKFHSVWGDVVIDDDSAVRDLNEIIADLNSRGIDVHHIEES